MLYSIKKKQTKKTDHVGKTIISEPEHFILSLSDKVLQNKTVSTEAYINRVKCYIYSNSCRPTYLYVYLYTISYIHIKLNMSLHWYNQCKSLEYRLFQPDVFAYL